MGWWAVLPAGEAAAAPAACRHRHRPARGGHARGCSPPLACWRRWRIFSKAASARRRSPARRPARAPSPASACTCGGWNRCRAGRPAGGEGSSCRLRAEEVSALLRLDRDLALLFGILAGMGGAGLCRQPGGGHVGAGGTPAARPGASGPVRPAARRALGDPDAAGRCHRRGGGSDGGGFRSGGGGGGRRLPAAAPPGMAGVGDVRAHGGAGRGRHLRLGCAVGCGGGAGGGAHRTGRGLHAE